MLIALVGFGFWVLIAASYLIQLKLAIYPDLL